MMVRVYRDFPQHSHHISSPQTLQSICIGVNIRLKPVFLDDFRCFSMILTRFHGTLTVEVGCCGLVWVEAHTSEHCSSFWFWLIFDIEGGVQYSELLSSLSWNTSVSEFQVSYVC